VRRLSRAVRRWRRRPGDVVGAAVFGVAVTGLHFGSMALALYTRVWWWDVMVHALSGLGVAAVLYVLLPRVFGARGALLVVLPLVVLAVGTWFEIYERLFTDFWYSWTRAYYLEDTAVDLVADTAGALAFGFFVVVQRRLGITRPHPEDPDVERL
jgi:hypothetical protein